MISSKHKVSYIKWANAKRLNELYMFPIFGSNETPGLLFQEKLILRTLKFRLNTPTPYVFMLRFLKAAQSDTKVCTDAKGYTIRIEMDKLSRNINRKKIPKKIKKLDVISLQTSYHYLYK